MMFGLDWNTLIVGKLSLWIQADSEIETERRNSEAVSFSLWILLYTDDVFLFTTFRG